MNSQRILGISRRVTWVLALAGGLYLWNRYELMRFPSGGCSPLVSLRPGSLLWIDRHARGASPGDVLFYHLPGGQTAIGRCSKVRDTPRAFWIVTDAPDCPGPSSAELGWFGPESLEGRLLLAF